MMSNQSKDLYRKSVSILRNVQIPSPELDARVIFEFVLNIDTTQFYKDLDNPISLTDIKKIEKLISKRAKNEPIAYLIGKKEFFGLDFLVNKNVLIPRPESEWLVEKSIKYLELSIKYKKIMKVLDMGTGSGNIIISVAKNHPGAEYYASDISKKVLDMARKNAKQYQIDNINFIHSDLFQNIDNDIKFDLIIANLPYVPKQVESQKSKVKSDIDFEPKNAIFAHDNGAEIIKSFLAESKNHLNIDSQILIELDPRNAMDIKNCAKENFPNAIIILRKDLAGFDRYLIIPSNQV